ncbi:hypothetical protein EEE23_00405 [Neisseria gonorrhoeae]|nr:hypothetical protein EGH12_08040 [Neisseria gonorrhoeae]PNL74647.1 hypothetical protein A6J45_003260 [Neisseria gonorrhoeae]ROU23491.1 hypothetical protein EGO66_00145 [Neisseria gonorrhoeae]ROU96469.1 hypothetical protein EGP30_00855 [Neisseria gonorrhoeae]ROV02649.1 hypothetical protein EGO75_00845 [Neisseria gonorrhoeae]
MVFSFRVFRRPLSSFSQYSGLTKTGTSLPRPGSKGTVP